MWKCNPRCYLMQGAAAAPPDRPHGTEKPHKPMTRTIFTFETTHDALWAEEVARARGVPAEVVPAPPAARARCNLALETFPADFEAMRTALREAGVPFAVHPPE